jgi:choline dehydrogenase
MNIYFSFLLILYLLLIAFIKNIKNKRSNLTVISDTLVNNLIFDENNKCIGINTISNDNNFNKIIFHANKEIILSAGSIGSVQILERSGIGDKELLSRLNIPIIKHLPGVGENLQDHLQLRTVFKISNLLKTLNINSQTILGMHLKY